MNSNFQIFFRVILYSIQETVKNILKYIEIEGKVQWPLFTSNDLQPISLNWLSRKRIILSKNLRQLYGSPFRSRCSNSKQNSQPFPPAHAFFSCATPAHVPGMSSFYQNISELILFSRVLLTANFSESVQKNDEMEL